MNLSHAIRRCSALLALAMASIAGVGVRAVELTPNSPFAPPSSNADANATPANSPLELHGILAMPDGYKFNLCDQAGRVNVWIGLNAPGQPFVVRSHDAAHNRVTVEYQGRELTLSLARAKVASMSMSPQGMPMLQPIPPSQPGAVNVSPQEERARLERIAEEIRRRRALREASQQPSQPAPPGANPAPAQPQN